MAIIFPAALVHLSQSFLFLFYYNLIFVPTRNPLFLGQAKGHIGQELGYLI